MTGSTNPPAAATVRSRLYLTFLDLNALTLDEYQTNANTQSVNRRWWLSMSVEDTSQYISRTS